MILPRFSFLALLSVTLATSLFADTVTLKNGTKIEGKITNETDTQLTIETKSGGIIDEQTVKKEDVQSVTKLTPDEIAYAALRSVKLGANSLPTPTQYDNYLTALKAFVSQHPQSKYKPEIEKLTADFEAEQKRVADGEVKLDGKWLSKVEVQRERYQINATVAANYMKEQSARGDAVGAMNTFELLEKQYPGSRGYIDAVDAAKRIVPALKQQADARIARLPAEIAEREKSIAGAAGLNKIELQGEYDREKQSNEAALAVAKRQQLKWPPFIPRNEESMKQISTLAGEAASRLASVDVAKARQSIQLANEARAALDKKDLTAAEEKVRAAREAWSTNELATRLDTEIADAKAAATAKAETPAEPAPAETTTPAETKPEMKKTEEKPAETTTTTPEAAASTSADSAPAEPPAEEESNPLFRLLLIIILAIVAFVGFKAYRNVRKKSSEVIE
jgi:hypothetical protein